MSFTLGDGTPPTVQSVSGTNNVSTTLPITVTFSEELDPATVNTSTFTVNGATGTVTYSGMTATFTPSPAFMSNMTYTATISGVKDLSGLPMTVNYSWAFTTAIPDVIPPTVQSSSPPDPVTGAISVVFSENMDPATITATQFTLKQGTTPIAGTVSYSQTTATFTPASALAANTIYTAAISTGVKDLAGNAMALPYTWSFGLNSINGLNYKVIDAEYSKSLDRIIMVSAVPSNQLHIYDPVTNSDTAVTLGLPPTSVSVSPDGLFAAVGHNAWISYVNLSTATVDKTLPVAADVLDIILAGNGYMYAFPRIDQWTQFHAVNIATGTDTPHTGMSIYAGTKAKLHPGGTSIYGANNGLSPADIEKYDITVGGTPAYSYDSPYHGDYAMCGDLWISEDGLRIFTRCGNVFNATNLQATDMYYAGALQGLALIKHLNHSSASSKVAAIPDNDWGYTNQDTEVRVFGYPLLAQQISIQLPYFTNGGTNYVGHGRFVFYNNSGTNFYVVLQADGTSGLTNDYGVTTY